MDRYVFYFYFIIFSFKRAECLSRKYNEQFSWLDGVYSLNQNIKMREQHIFCLHNGCELTRRATVTASVALWRIFKLIKTAPANSKQGFRECIRFRPDCLLYCMTAARWKCSLCGEICANLAVHVGRNHADQVVFRIPY
jgi:hypothetical protein